MSRATSNPRLELEKWHEGSAWKPLVSRLIEEVVQLYGKEAFRERKGGARAGKEICEEALPLANLLAAGGFEGWQGRLTATGDQADALLRQNLQGAEIPVQIVGAFDGESFAADMKQLNAEGSTSAKVDSRHGIEAQQTLRVVKSINAKGAKGYPANYWLVVGVEEGLLDLPQMGDLLDKAGIAARRTTFERVYLAGLDSSGNVRRVK